jgi:hypothetical protein
MSAAARRFAEERTWSASLRPVYAFYRSALADPLANPAAAQLSMPADAPSRA